MTVATGNYEYMHMYTLEHAPGAFETLPFLEGNTFKEA